MGMGRHFLLSRHRMAHSLLLAILFVTVDSNFGYLLHTRKFAGVVWNNQRLFSGGQEIVPATLQFQNIHRSSNPPSSCQYIVSNPTFNKIDRSLANKGRLTVPLVYYVADKHSDYGTLGFSLNKRNNGATVGQFYPSLRYLRDRPLYDGGQTNSGSALTMIHKRTGFPENR